MNLAESRILVTGGGGFVGRHVINTLKARGYQHLHAPTRLECDLRDGAAVTRLITRVAPKVIIHLAARVGGIGANRARPGEFFYDNVMMGAQLMEQARLHAVDKFIGVGTICSYPKMTPVPFSEDTLWDGYPEETNAPYGIAKKMLLVQGNAYRAQYGFNAIHLLPVNLYGPGDNFDPDSSHVIPALIKKCFDAIDSGASEIVVWGDGTATREFLYVDDAAEAIVLATERYDKPEPVNVGAGFEVSIGDLAARIARFVGFTGRIVWDASQASGQLRRRLDTTRAEREFGFRARTTLDDGLARIIDWFRAWRQRA